MVEKLGGFVPTRPSSGSQRTFVAPPYTSLAKTVHQNCGWLVVDSVSHIRQWKGSIPSPLISL